jgi:hypothetical protein
MVRLTRFALVVAAGALAACGPPDPTPAAIFPLSFQGEASCDLASVGSVRVSIPAAGVDVRESCGAGGITVVVPDLPPGTYDTLVQAFDAFAPTQVAFSTRQQIVHTAAGTHRYPLDLDGVTEVVTRFVFAAGPAPDKGLDCRDARVSRVTVVFTPRAGGAAPSTYDVEVCRGDDRSDNAAALTDLTGGRYDITAEAFDDTGRKLYASSFLDQNVVRAGSNDFELNLLPALAGGLELTWEFDLGSRTTQSCGEAGVDRIEFVLVGPTGERLTYAGADAWRCADGPIRFRWDEPQSAFPPGRYTLKVVNAYAQGSASLVLYTLKDLPIYIPAGRDQGFVVPLS